LGKPVPVRLDPLENEIARQLGDGIISEGVRLALRAAQINGIEVSLAAAKKFGQAVGREPPAPAVSDVSTETCAASDPQDTLIDPSKAPTVDLAVEQVKTSEALN
jgi:hypothetical protein